MGRDKGGKSKERERKNRRIGRERGRKRGRRGKDAVDGRKLE
jgi:hypothetical protein